MAYKLKDIFSRGKPENGNSELWDEYVTSGEQKHFRLFNYFKTLGVGALIAFAVNLIMGATTDFFLHPKPFATFDYSSLMIGILILIFVAVGLWIVDRMEELRRFRDKEKELQKRNELKREIHEEIIAYKCEENKQELESE